MRTMAPPEQREPISRSGSDANCNICNDRGCLDIIVSVFCFLTPTATSFFFPGTNADCNIFTAAADADCNILVLDESA